MGLTIEQKIRLLELEKEQASSLDAESTQEQPAEVATAPMTQEQRNEMFESEPPMTTPLGNWLMGVPEDVGQAMKEAPTQLVAGVVTGGKVTSLNPLKRAGIDIPVQFIAKEADEWFGFAPQDDPWYVNLAEATAEQGFGELSAKILQKFGVGVGKEVLPEDASIMAKSGADKPIHEGLGGLTAKQIEEKRFQGKETFLATERTLGDIGKGQADNLSEVAALTKELFYADPRKAKLFARNKMIQDDMRKQLNTPLGKQTFSKNNVYESVRSAADTNLQNMSNTAIRNLNDSGLIAKTAKTREFNAVKFKQLLDYNEASIKRSVGETEYKLMLSKLAKARTSKTEVDVTKKVMDKFTGGMKEVKEKKLVPQIEDNITGEDLNSIMEGMLATFSDKNERGYFLANIWGEFKDILSTATSKEGSAFAKKYSEASEQFIQLSHVKDAGEAYKMMSGIDDLKAKRLFKDLNLYRDVVASMKKAEADPDSLKYLFNDMAVESMVNPANRQVESARVISFVKEFGRENIEAILGKDRLETFDIIGSTAYMVEQNKKIMDIARANANTVTKQEAIKEALQNTAAGTDTPIRGMLPRVSIDGALSFVNQHARRVLGLTDEKALKNAMMSGIGNVWVKTNLRNKESYHLYVNMVRELGVKPVGRAIYDNLINDLEEEYPLHSIDTGLNDVQQQSVPQQ